MNKYEAISILLDKKDIPYTSYDNLIKVISKKSYKLSKELGLHSRKVKAILDTLAPDRRPGEKLCSYILRINDCKFCSRCEVVKFVEDFTKNKSRNDGLNVVCKDCQYETFKSYYPEYYKNNKDKYAAAKVKYKLRLIEATAKWANLEKINEIYKNCPEGYHVDHIIPLQGENVCGLHVEDNLQYLSAFDNLSKGNKFSS